jgi:hypothetical protein
MLSMTSGFFPKWKLLSAIPNKEGEGEEGDEAGN